MWTLGFEVSELSIWSVLVGISIICDLVWSFWGSVLSFVREGSRCPLGAAWRLSWTPGMRNEYSLLRRLGIWTHPACGSARNCSAHTWAQPHGFPCSYASNCSVKTRGTLRWFLALNSWKSPSALELCSVTSSFLRLFELWPLSPLLSMMAVPFLGRARCSRQRDRVPTELTSFPFSRVPVLRCLLASVLYRCFVSVVQFSNWWRQRVILVSATPVWL